MGLGYYVHIPFCRQKCGYCDFVSYAGQEGKMAEYVQALTQEIAGCPDQTIDTIFLGGGTPTTLAPEQIEAILSAIRRHNRVEKHAEITIEVNPETLEERGAEQLLEMGINRFSIGLQSGEDHVLKSAGRRHSHRAFEACYGGLRRAGAGNISIDLMMGLPGQTYQGFGETVKQVRELAPEHVSVYELTLSETSPLAREVERGDVSLPPEEEIAALSGHLEGLQKAYPRYEISNYAQPGYECRHNLNYWNNGQYVGVGCAAHGCIEGGALRYANPAGLAEYLATPGRRATQHRLTRQEQMLETLILGTRLVAGVDLAAFERRYGQGVPPALADYILEHPHLVECTQDHLRLTPRGLELQNTVLVDWMMLLETK